MIKKLVLTIVVVALFAGIGFGAPLCMVGTMADYVALGAGGCQIDDKLFYNFEYSGSGQGATAISDQGVTVMPIMTALNPGFLFNAPWTVGPGQTLDSLISFTVLVLPGGRAIGDISAMMRGNGRVPDGTVGVAENTSVGNLLLYDSALGVKTFDRLPVPPTPGPITVHKDISVNGNSGFATVSGVWNQFSEVPEPVTLVLMGSALLGLGLLRRRLGAM